MNTEDAVGVTDRRTALLNRLQNIELLKETFEMVNSVRDHGQEAILSHYRRKGIDRTSIEVDGEEIAEALRNLSAEDLAALKTLAYRVGAMADCQQAAIQRPVTLDNGGSFTSILSSAPLNVVGIYIPRNLPSSLVLYCALARAAGVQRLVLALPPGTNGTINPALLAAASLFDIHTIIAVGGRSAFPALAFGVAGPVPDKLFGPCGFYVDHVKQILSTFYKIPVDMASGPSELVIFADRHSDIKQIEYDARAQMEHGADSVCFVVSTDETLLRVVSEVTADIQSQVELVHVAAVGDALDVINGVAPEILEIFSDNPSELLDGLTGAANVYVNTCSPLGDYCVTGKGCADPTYGTARGVSGITIESFRKASCISTRKGTAVVGEPWMTDLPTLEGFTYHRRAIERCLTGHD